MSALKQDFAIDQGDDASFAFDCTDETTGADFVFDGTVTDVIWALSALASDTVALIRKDLAAGVSIPTPSGKRAVVAVVAADTLTLAGRYHHELKVIKGGKRDTLARGLVDIRPTVEPPG